MSYNEYSEAHKSTEFAPFLKARHVRAFPLKVEIVSVDQQKLPQTGDSLVARIRFNAALKGKLKPEYVASLEAVKAQDIGLPLNKTNAKAFASLFGDAMKNWKGTVTLMAVPVNNPKTNTLTQGLVVLTQGESK